MFDLCEAVIRNYINTYNENGLKGLFPTKPPGRPPKIGNWTKEDWDKVLEQTPNQYDKILLLTNGHLKDWLCMSRNTTTLKLPSLVCIIFARLEDAQDAVN